MKARIEDLGYLRAKLEEILDEDDLWDHRRYEIEKCFERIKKDLAEAIEDDTTLLWMLLCRLEWINGKLWDCLEIAKGEDYLNQPEDGS